MFTATYIICIVVVNYGFTVIPLIKLPWGEAWPPLSLIVGLIFVLRDFAQREIGHHVILAMLFGGMLSYFMADPFVAIASVTAFLFSEFTDWAIYTFTKRPFHSRVLLSSSFSTPIDSAIFLAMIGHLSLLGILIMTASKMLGALAIWGFMRRRNVSRTG